MTIIAQIAAAEKELTLRQIVAPNLKGHFQITGNAHAIERLYDTLTRLHIERIEGAA